MSSISELQKAIHENAKNKGFWDKEPNTGEKLMLIVSEVSEAMEADREDKHFNPVEWGMNNALNGTTDEAFVSWFRDEVKNTYADELCDAIIRILDLAEHDGINMEWHIKAKMRYNATRPHMHGKKY